jgi:HEAT repeat protein
LAEFLLSPKIIKSAIYVANAKRIRNKYKIGSIVMSSFVKDQDSASICRSSNNTHSETLNQFISSKNEAYACYGARTAGKIGADGTIDSLLECIYHEDVDVVIDAIEALGKLKAVSAIDILIDAVELHPDGDVRVSAAKALANMANENVLQHFLSWAKSDFSERDNDVLWNDDWDIQLLAIESLGRFKYQSAARALNELLEEHNLDIEGQILKALTIMGDAGTAQVIKRLENAETEPDPVHELRIARRAATALSSADCQQSSLALAAAMHYSDASLRASAVSALAKRKATQYASDMLALLKDPNDNVKTAAIDAIVSLMPDLDAKTLQISSEELLGQLVNLNTSGRIFIYRLMMAMADKLTLDDAQKMLLQRGLSSENVDEQVYICQLISDYDDTSAVGVLIENLQSEGVNLRAMQAMLVSLGKVAANDLAPIKCINTLLAHKSSALCLSALEALVNLAQKQAVNESFNANTLLFEYVLKEQTIDNTVLETLANPQLEEGRIALQAVDNEGNVEISPSVLKAQSEAASEAQKMQTILASISDDYPDQQTEEIAPIFVNQPSEIVSTLEAIQRDAITAFVTPQNEPADDASGLHIREMVEQLPEDEQDFANIVTGHLDSGEKVKLSRKKIAKHPSYSNKVLTIKALASYADESVVDALLEQFLYDDLEVQIAAVSSLIAIANTQPKLIALKKALGPLCTLLMSGNDHLRLVCARALGVLSVRSSLAIMLEALHDSDSNVRIQGLDSLSQYIAKHNSSHTIGQSIAKIMPAAFAMLQDNTTGVVIKALAIIAENKTALADDEVAEVLEKVITVGCSDENYMNAAALCVAQIDASKAGQLLYAHLEDEVSSAQHILSLQMLGIVLES